MGKTKFCRICRTAENLKYTTKELKQLNKEQILMAQANNSASKKLLLSTPTLGNICVICDERIQIFHRVDDGDNEISSDIEVDVGNVSVTSANFVNTLPNSNVAQITQRPETPVIVDDDDMLFNIFMQKFDQKSQLPQHQINSPFSHPLQNALMTNFHSTYTPPQSTGGSSEGDETKIIEVLTSRESTPAPTLPKPAFTKSTKPAEVQPHRIVAIIDLDDGDDECDDIVESQKDVLPTPNPQFSQKDILTENNAEYGSVLLTPQKCLSVTTNQNVNVDDDEEIIFKKVDNQQENSLNLKKRRHKTYDEKNLRLVACLNLVSSDSETEDTATIDQVQKLTNVELTVPSVPILRQNVICKVCNTKFPDSESLSVHERIHRGVMCALCKIGFSQVKRLIHHMRRKHREYNGDTLSEKPRSGQDSCMTIRLRYMHQTTFYECQLCGRIDEVFKEHKDHILETHPNESKSLKDPIIKQLKCPVCKVKCGAQYLSLCRHLISIHEYPEYKSHLRELVHVSAFGWNASRQQEVAKTAKIFQFIKRKTFFFECKICSKVVAGYLHHLRHVNEHQKRFSDKTSKTVPKPSLPLQSFKNINPNDIDGVCVSKNLRNRESLTKLSGRSKFENKEKQNEKIEKVPQKLPKLEKTSIKVSKFKTNYAKNVKTQLSRETMKKLETETKNTISKKIKLKNKCKPKEKHIVKSRICEKITPEKKKKKEATKKDKHFKKPSAKVKYEAKYQVKKVKIKAQIRQIDLQKYKCKYCLKRFKGFRCYNLHLMHQHKDVEFSKCNKCNKMFASPPILAEHVNICSQLSNTLKRKRKISDLVSLSENCQPLVKKVPDTSDDSKVDFVENNLWLNELLALKRPPNISDSSLSLKESPKTALLKFQCCYCLHFLGNDKDLKEHKELNHLQNTHILFKYKPLKT